MTVPQALHFKAQLNLQEDQTEFQTWYAIAANGTSGQKRALIQTLHARPLTSGEEAALQSDLLAEMAKTPDESLQKAVLREAASWRSHLPYEARVLEQLAHHGGDALRRGIVHEIGTWKGHLAESAVVLKKTVAENGNPEVQAAVLKEIRRWGKAYPERAIVLHQLAETGDHKLKLSIIQELAGWDTHPVQQADILKTIARAGDPILNHAIGKELNRWNRNHRALIMEVMREIATPWINGPQDRDYILAGFLPGQLLKREDIHQARRKWEKALARNDLQRRREVKAALDILEEYAMN